MTDGGPDAVRPQAARDRMVQARGGGTWGSMLSTDEFAAVRGVGFDPAGQVFGACVYNLGYVGAFGCAGGWSSSDLGPARALTRVSGEGDFGIRPLVQALYEARHKAIDRMTAECAALGGHGIVGVSLTSGEFPFGGMEFQSMGTAVRGACGPGPPHPFSSDLSGQDFAKLIHAGWVPVGVALGISIGARHDDQQTSSTTARGAGNAEVDGYTGGLPGSPRGSHDHWHGYRAVQFRRGGSGGQSRLPVPRSPAQAGGHPRRVNPHERG